MPQLYILNAASEVLWEFHFEHSSEYSYNDLMTFGYRLKSFLIRSLGEGGNSRQSKQRRPTCRIISKATLWAAISGISVASFLSFISKLFVLGENARSCFAYRDSLFKM